MHWVYIMASAPRGTLYIGVTDDIVRRSREHANLRGSAFTKKYGVNLLVWFQAFHDHAKAAQRERTMKEWPRDWKINLVERQNPGWIDLRPTLKNPADPVIYTMDHTRDPGDKPRG